MSKEKKKTIIFTVSLAVVALLLIGVFIFMELKQTKVIGSSESNEIMLEFNEVYNSKERSIVYYASTGCGYCELQKPILETIVEDYDLEYYSIDSTLLSNSQRNEVLEKLEIEHATPTLVIVENGKVIDTQVGYTEGSKLVSFFIKNKILKKGSKYSAEEDITFIDYEQYTKLIRSKNTNIIVVGQSSCSHCIAFKPAINSVADDYDITINYLNLTEMSQDESTKFFKSLEDIEYNDPDFLKDGSFGTPLTLIVENGKVISYFSGQRTISQLVRELKKVGLIEE